MLKIQSFILKTIIGILLISSQAYGLLEEEATSGEPQELLNCSIDVCHSSASGSYLPVNINDSGADVVDLCMEQRTSDSHRWLPISVQTTDQTQAVALFDEKYSGNYDLLLKSPMSCVPVANYKIENMTESPEINTPDYVKWESISENADGSFTVFKPWIHNSTISKFLGTNSDLTGTCKLMGFTKHHGRSFANSGTTDTVKINSGGHIVASDRNGYYRIISITCSK